MIEQISGLHDLFYRLDACDEFQKAATRAPGATEVDRMREIEQFLSHGRFEPGASEAEEPKTRGFSFGIRQPVPEIAMGWDPDPEAPKPGETDPKPDAGSERPFSAPARSTFKADFESQKAKTPAAPEKEVEHRSNFLDHLDKMLSKHLSSSMGQGLQALSSPSRNTGQELIDTRFNDARSIAVLQNLMTTDDVLSEADPDRLVEIYNTVRENAPGISRDANVMRVLLRSAVQHDGISTFDLKSWIDTESSKQKLDADRRRLADERYNPRAVPRPDDQPGSDKR
jgi:hypothetical protein